MVETEIFRTQLLAEIWILIVFLESRRTSYAFSEIQKVFNDLTDAKTMYVFDGFELEVSKNFASRYL